MLHVATFAISHPCPFISRFWRNVRENSRKFGLSLRFADALKGVCDEVAIAEVQDATAQDKNSRKVTIRPLNMCWEICPSQVVQSATPCEIVKPTLQIVCSLYDLSIHKNIYWFSDFVLNLLDLRAKS